MKRLLEKIDALAERLAMPRESRGLAAFAGFMRGLTTADEFGDISVGVTWDDPNDPVSVAYDRGVNLGAAVRHPIAPKETT